MQRISSFRQLVCPLRARCYSQAVQTAPAAQLAPLAVQYPYYVPRNSRGSIPVYSDVRNAGGRYLIQIRNIEGNVPALAHDLERTLFPTDSPTSARLRIEIKASKHLVISGTREKHKVIEWFQQKGF